jgi:uncharacterized protein YecE (DUF72 family)
MGILLGTSGWEYSEWVGPVYPRVGGRDRLRYYAGIFPIVEVNSTFYRLPAPSVARRWVERTPAGFRFAAKFPQSITHHERLKGSGDDLARFLEVLRPIREAGRFAAALLQLPPSLPFDEPTVRAFAARIPSDLPVAVEFREASWMAPSVFDLMRELRWAYVVVDEPFLPIRLEVTAPFAYLRLHGRGHPLWYDYTYSPAELAAWVPRIEELARRADPVYVFFNNHFRGDAAAHARTMSAALGLPPPPGAYRLDRSPPA